MNVVDQIITQAHQQNPILGGLLGVLMDGGRVISTSEKISELLSMVPDVFFFEQRPLSDLKTFTDFSYKDLIFFENPSVDLLWNFSHISGAQVAVLSLAEFDASLSDYQVKEEDLRSALMSIRPLMGKVKEFHGDISFDGSRLRKGLFLDRDGVVIEDVSYIQNPDQVKIAPGVVSALKKARELDYQIFIVTNQSGLGRGLYNFSSYEKVNHRMLQLLANEGVFIDEVVKAPYFEKSQYASGLVRKSLRKPRPGMIHSVAAKFRIDLTSSIMVGDKATDLMAAAVSGIEKCFLMKTSNAEEEHKSWRYWPVVSRTKVGLRLPEIKSLEEIFQ